VPSSSEDKNDIYSEENTPIFPESETLSAETLPTEASSTSKDEPIDAMAEIEKPEVTEVPEVPTPLEESQLPPEAQGETNGGPLGCCLGTTIGLLLCISIALLSRFYSVPLAHLLGGALSIVTRLLMALVAIVAVFVCGYFGWRIGKNVYREYNSPLSNK
jgi:hypothetical protein